MTTRTRRGGTPSCGQKGCATTPYPPATSAGAPTPLTGANPATGPRTPARIPRPPGAGQDAPADITSAAPELPVNPDIIPVDPDTPVNPVDPDTPADTEQHDGPIAGPAAPADQDTIPEEPGPDEPGQPEPAPQNYRQLTLLPPVN